VRAQLPATPLSRRRLLAASGATLAAGSAVALAACGSSEDDDAGSPEEDATALNQVLAAQLALQTAISPAREAQAGSSLEPALVAFAQETDKLIQDLGDAIDTAGGTATTEASDAASQAESAVEGLRDETNAAILAATEAVADITNTDAIATVYRTAFTDAANLSVLDDVLGGDPAPEAFVGVAGAEGSS
jgi:hypothetical protein